MFGPSHRCRDPPQPAEGARSSGGDGQGRPTRTARPDRRAAPLAEAARLTCGARSCGPRSPCRAPTSRSPTPAPGRRRVRRQRPECLTLPERSSRSSASRRYSRAWRDLEVFLQVLPPAAGERKTRTPRSRPGRRGRRPAACTSSCWTAPHPVLADAGPRCVAVHPLLGVPERVPGLGGRVPFLRLGVPGPIGAVLRRSYRHRQRYRQVAAIRVESVRRLLRRLSGTHRHPVDAGAPAYRVVDEGRGGVPSVEQLAMKAAAGCSPITVGWRRLARGGARKGAAQQANRGQTGIAFAAVACQRGSGARDARMPPTSRSAHGGSALTAGGRTERGESGTCGDPRADPDVGRPAHRARGAVDLRPGVGTGDLDVVERSSNGSPTTGPRRPGGLCGRGCGRRCGAARHRGRPGGRRRGRALDLARQRAVASPTTV